MKKLCQAANWKPAWTLDGEFETSWDAKDEAALIDHVPNWESLGGQH